MPKSTLTAAIALAHERLYPRVTALLKQVERSAARHPEHPVPATTRAVADTLFAEARKILGREALRGAGSATADLSALAVGLGQLVAMLEAFEAEHSGFSAGAKCVVWRLDEPDDRPPRPVTRLKPSGIEAGEPSATDNGDGIRSKLTRLILARYASGYDTGYRDASEGRPPSSEYAERVWDGQVKDAEGDEPARLRELKRRYGTTRPPPHLMPVGAKPGEWRRINAEREAIERAERLARSGGSRPDD